MTFEVIGLVALCIGLWSAISGGVMKYYGLVVSTLFGSAAAIVLPSLGAVSIQPAHLILLVLAVGVFANPHAWSVVIPALRFPKSGFWLIATVAYGALGALLFPRLFAGSTYVNAIGVTEYGPSFSAVPLAPTSGNFTQTVYFAGDFVCFCIAYVWASAPGGVGRLVSALLAYCIGNVLFAGIDLATFWTGTGYLLEFMRNAAYTLHDETVVYGLKRIVGSFTEASSFAYASIGALGFALRLWLGGYRPWLTFALSVVTLALLVFSTSTTAYAALPVFLLLAYFYVVVQVLTGRSSRAMASFVVFAPLVVAVILLVIALQPALQTTVSDYMNVLVFNKGATQSGIDRGRWNEIAVRNVIDTYGLGAGIGSVRASSFVVAVLANLGIPGAITFGVFLASLFRRSIAPCDVPDDLFRSAAQFGCIALLIAGSISGALIDLGLPFFIMAGLASAILDRAQQSHVEEKHRAHVLRGPVMSPVREPIRH